MGTYAMSAEERVWLETYHIEDFDRPSVAADMAVFSIMGTEMREAAERKNYRKDPEKYLKLLLIRRGSHPFKNRWALPGGFCRRGESTQETARRELQEETGVRDAYLRPFAYHENLHYEIVNAGGLAFDHASVILRAFLELRRQVEAGGTIVFDLMPELFTLSELQKAYEVVLGRTLLTANFRRKIAPLWQRHRKGLRVRGIGRRGCSGEIWMPFIVNRGR